VTKNELLDGIARERTRLIAAIDATGHGATTLRVTAEGWTPKDVLAHLIHWARAVAFGLGIEVPPPVYMQEERSRRAAAGLGDGMPSGDESNALAVRYYDDHPYESVRAEFERLVNSVIQNIGKRTEEDLRRSDAIPWAPGRPLWHFVAGDTVMHWPVHAADIERAVTHV
jgi:hypothetical protein